MKLFDFLFGRKKAAGSISSSRKNMEPASIENKDPAESVNSEKGPEQTKKGQSNQQQNTSREIIFVRNENGPRPGVKYEIYKGQDAQSAKVFLKTKTVSSDFHYILVETPEGNWGLDVKGFYFEHLLPFQFDLSLATHEGKIAAIPNSFNLGMAARGVNDNFVTEISCGNCANQWSDAIRYKNLTVVKCPSCKTFNKVDSKNFIAHFV